MKNEREEYSHPSYGMIGFSRVNSGGKNTFFGSELPVDHWIEMTVLNAKVQRDLSKDWFFSDGRTPVIKVRMTPGQFSEMITSLNQGDGVPCTLVNVDGKEIQQEAFRAENRKEITDRQFKQRMKDFAASLLETQKKAKDIVKKKTLSKDDQHELTLALDWLITETTNNIPYFAQCFQEQMDKMVYEAKLEVENAIQHKITTLGLTELHKQNELLTNKKNEDENLQS